MRHDPPWQSGNAAESSPAGLRAPLSAEALHRLTLDITEPIPDLYPPADAWRVACGIEAGIAMLGELVLPAFDGIVPTYVLADAIAAEFGWTILEQYFETSVYPSLTIERRADGLAVRRGEVLLAGGLPLMEGSRTHYIHDQAGWGVFLQEFWGRPDQPLGWFYDPTILEQGADDRQVPDGLLVLDARDALPDVHCRTGVLSVLFTIGGANLAMVAIPAVDGRVTAHQLRVAITEACGFELCTAAVREGILGRPFAGSGSLRDRLARIERPQADVRQSLALGRPEQQTGLVGDWRAAVTRALGPQSQGVVIGRRPTEGCETSTARRVAFPASAGPEILEACSRLGEVWVRAGAGPGSPARLVYCPELLTAQPGTVDPKPSVSQPPGHPRETPSRRFDRGMFEELYVSEVDPWQTESPFERAKYQQSLDLLPSLRFARALEVGCAEGNFTERLASRVGHLVAADISRVALERAARRCEGRENVEYLPFDLATDPIPGRFDLIVCSEVLYFLPGRANLHEAAGKLAAALQPSGHLLTANANLVADEPDRPGYSWDHAFGGKAISETFEAMPTLQLVKELRTPLYRIQLFQRIEPGSGTRAEQVPEIRELSRQPVRPQPPAEAEVLWQGGSPTPAAEEETRQTAHLPILMYHRVAPQGSEALAQYRVSPAQFEEQLKYLKDTGHYTITVEQWHAAMRRHEPLAGQAVLITFDDGYLDFATQAWPLLDKYGFSATVFLVAGELGGTNRWDQDFGEQVPLLGWDEIRTLADLGVQFGSHSTSHPDLTRISPAEVVRETIRSRAILQEGLGRPIRSFAYPHGGEDQVVRHLVGGSGYTYGFSCRPGRAGLWGPLLALPRIDVNGCARFEDFVRGLMQEYPADES